jgi:uncharacterized protein
MSAISPIPVRYLVLWLTSACNLRCACCYCGDQPARTMSFDVARAAVELAAASGLPFHVQMAGGEPSLVPELVEAVGQMVRQARWPATMAVQTNGTLIDKRFIDLCRRFSISVGISVDGPPDVQDRVRKDAGAAFRGLMLLDRANMEVRVTTTVCALNVMDLGRLILALASFANVRGIALDPVVLKGNALKQDAIIPSTKSLCDGVRTMFDMLEVVNRFRSNPIRWRELDSVRNALKGNGKQRNYCHACGGESLAVHPDGTVYPCGQTVGDPAMQVGSLDRVDWRRLHDIFLDVRLGGDCPGCLLEERCPGDCPSRIHYNRRSAPENLVCRIYRTIAECIEGGSLS